MKTIITMWIFYLALTVTIIFVCRHSYKAAVKAPGHYPYVLLNTEERICVGDTLYVCYASEDTVIVWGK